VGSLTGRRASMTRPDLQNSGPHHGAGGRV